MIIYWESQYLDRLIRSSGSARKRKGSGALEVEIGVWNSEGGEKGKLFFFFFLLCIPSVQFSQSGMSNYLQPHKSQHARPPGPSPTPRDYSNSCPSSQWYHPAISFSVIPFSSCPQSLPASRSFLMSQLFTWGGQSIAISAPASVLPMNFSRVQIFAILWTIACQAPLSMAFSRQEYWSGLPSSRGSSYPGIEPASPRLLHCRRTL